MQHTVPSLSLASTSLKTRPHARVFACLLALRVAVGWRVSDFDRTWSVLTYRPLHSAPCRKRRPPPAEVSWSPGETGPGRQIGIIPPCAATFTSRGQSAVWRNRLSLVINNEPKCEVTQMSPFAFAFSHQDLLPARHFIGDESCSLLQPNQLRNCFLES